MDEENKITDNAQATLDAPKEEVVVADRAEGITAVQEIIDDDDTKSTVENAPSECENVTTVVEENANTVLADEPETEQSKETGLSEEPREEEAKQEEKPAEDILTEEKEDEPSQEVAPQEVIPQEDKSVEEAAASVDDTEGETAEEAKEEEPQDPDYLEAKEEVDKLVEESAPSMDERLKELRESVLALFDDYRDDLDHAYEVGVSGIYDDYHREILEPVFENVLRMTPNIIKLTYSKLKNALLSFKDVKQKYCDAAERFQIGNKRIAVMTFDNADKLNLYLNLDSTKVDKKEFPHRLAAKKEYMGTPVCVTDFKTKEAIQRAITLIEKAAEEAGAVKKKVFVPVAYAERYPVNPDAVLRGREQEPPVVGCYDGEEYNIIVGELSSNIIEELMGDKASLVKEKKGGEKLAALRQQAETIKDAEALTEPIVYFYDSAVNADSTVNYVNVQQVLNDKFLGKMLPQQFLTVAEDSGRVEDLNLLCLDTVVGDCNRMPNYTFMAVMSVRHLLKEANLERLIKRAKTENNNLVLAFDCNLLACLGDVGVKAITLLRGEGLHICAENVENATMNFLSEFDIDYYRFDGRYYKEEDIRRLAQLDIIVNYAKVQAIKTVANNIDSTKLAKLMLTHGVEVIQGSVVCEPKRLVSIAVKEIKKLPLVGG